MANLICTAAPGSKFDAVTVTELPTAPVESDNVTVRALKILIGVKALPLEITTFSDREPVVAPVGTVTEPLMSPDELVDKPLVAAESQPEPSAAQNSAVIVPEERLAAHPVPETLTASPARAYPLTPVRWPVTESTANVAVNVVNEAYARSVEGVPDGASSETSM